jgi:hypothetical protein
VLECIRYPIPNRKDLVSYLSNALVFSKFDMKSGFWQVQIDDCDRATQIADKFHDIVIDKTQLQRFLDSLNYIDFYKDFRKYCKLLFDRLLNNPPPWSDIQTNFHASEIGFGGILKQLVSLGSPEQIVRFHSGSWNSAQSNYSTIKKEILSVVLYITKFQSDLLNQRFLLKIDCKSAKYILKKDVENIVSKQIFSRWEAILSAFDFEVLIIQLLISSLVNFCSATMASKKDKEKIESQPLVLKPESTPFTPSPLSLSLFLLTLLFTLASLLPSTYFILKRIILILSLQSN